MRNMLEKPRMNGASARPAARRPRLGGKALAALACVLAACLCAGAAFATGEACNEKLAVSDKASFTVQVAQLDEAGVTLQEQCEAVEVPATGEKADLLASAADAKSEPVDASFQWQILVDAEAGVWTDIQGQADAGVGLTLGMVSGALDADGVAQVRCVATAENGEAAVSDPVKVTVAKAGEGDGSAAAASAASADQPAPVVLSGTKVTGGEAASSRSANGGIALMDADSDVKKTYNIVINYKFENNEIVSDPYTANLAEGSSFSATVTFPTVQGYLPYVGETQQNSIELNYSSVSEDVTINVVYKPTNVNYTVIHYQQNVENDQYTEVERETKQGLTASQVPEVAKTYDGFYSLIYERPAIAAGGSTVIEVYYDRYYYLMNFDMDGGYGTEPVYARYGASISAADPTKAGYKLRGWSETKGGTTAVTLPTTMPAENKTYYAIWEPDATAKVTVVFWGENADDEKYSYLADNTKVINLKPGREFTYTESEMLVCDKEVHTHTDSCLICEKIEHTHSSVGGGCYTLKCAHAHTVGCYYAENNRALKETTEPTQDLTDAGDGVYTYEDSGWFGSTHYFVKIGDKWYCGQDRRDNADDTQKITFKCSHNHSDSCYIFTCTTEEHSHNSDCYSCGKEQHTHNSGCYMQGAGLDNKLWKFVKSDTITVAADGSSVCNVYYDRTEFTLTFRANGGTVATIKAKWGAEISGEFSKAPFNTTYDGRAWECTETSKYSYALQTLDRMPQFDAAFNLYNKSSNTLKTIYYYAENVGANVSHDSWPTDRSNFTSLKKVTTYFNYATYNEEYHEIEGFTRYSARVAGFSDDVKHFNNNNELYLYYLRNSYNLTFNDQYNNVKDESVEFEAPLSAYMDYMPEVPSAYEPGSVKFGGWYQNPQCTGEEYKLDEHTMPSNDVILYAKWVPVNHTVTFCLDKEAYDAGTKLDTHPAITVPHGALADPTPAVPTKGSYEFVGWFYMDNGVEKAFDFANMQVRKDLNVYGKWSSNTLKEYTVQYVLKDDHSVKVADDLTGSGLAGTTKTFDAKGATDLYAAYQEGYFPTVQSQSLLLNIDEETLTVTFEYVPMPAAPYTVKYVEKDTGKSLAEDKVVSDNRKAVVTETFKTISGYMPDAYQKRLVVTADGENVLYFYYTKDTEHAYYKITHWKQSAGGTAWTEHASSQAVGDIGTRYTASPMTIPGYTYDHIEYKVNETEITDVTAEGAELTANGLEINLYYVVNNYPYQVRYLEQGSGKQLADPKDGTGKYGEVISESAIDIDDYDKVDPTSATLNIRIEEDEGAPKLNVITFYYKEQEVTINYKAVGPAGATDFGSVDPTTETVKVKSGTAQGSTPTAGDGYKFVGWFEDAACTDAVDGSWIDSANKLTPQKADGKNVAATYYAKFEADTTSLTIKKAAADGTTFAGGETFVFNVSDSDGFSKQVVVYGEDSVTIDGLKVGETYAVTENKAWSWRYGTTTVKVGNDDEISGVSAEVKLVADASSNKVTFTNTKTKNNWLDFSGWCQNLFKDGKIQQTKSN